MRAFGLPAARPLSDTFAERDNAPHVTATFEQGAIFVLLNDVQTNGRYEALIHMAKVARFRPRPSRISSLLGRTPRLASVAGDVRRLHCVRYVFADSGISKTSMKIGNTFVAVALGR